MKIIEALKQQKELLIKADDLRKKVRDHCAYLDYETPVYQDQKAQIREWIQAHHDILKEVERLRLAVQRTNIETDVTINIDERHVTKSIAGWIHRRRELAQLERDMWRMLTDRNLKEGHLQPSQGSAEARPVKIVRCFDPQERDKKLDVYSREPQIIDAQLEIVNAITDLIE